MPEKTRGVKAASVMAHLRGGFLCLPRLPMGQSPVKESGHEQPPDRQPREPHAARCGGLVFDDPLAGSCVFPWRPWLGGWPRGGWLAAGRNSGLRVQRRNFWLDVAKRRLAVRAFAKVCDVHFHSRLVHPCVVRGHYAFGAWQIRGRSVFAMGDVIVICRLGHWRGSCVWPDRARPALADWRVSGCLRLDWWVYLSAVVALGADRRKSGARVFADWGVDGVTVGVRPFVRVKQHLVGGCGGVWLGLCPVVLSGPRRVGQDPRQNQASLIGHRRMALRNSER